VQSYFDAQSAVWDDLYRGDPAFVRRFKLLTAFISEALGDRKPGRAFDAGCGSGTFSLFLAGQGWDVTGMDSAPGAAMTARLNAVQGGHGDACTFLVGSIDAVDAALGPFELVLSLSSLEYVDDDARAIASLAALTAPGGFLILTVPNQRSLVRTVERWAVRRRAKQSYLEFQRHQYVPRELDRRVEALGFRKVSELYWQIWPGAREPLQARLGRLEGPRLAMMYGAAYVSSTTAPVRSDSTAASVARVAVR
jgi:2-polyprenyl-3-methyl-5-hydroxy-6-metoxy-1,4-benzoquinol methylase